MKTIYNLQFTIYKKAISQKPEARSSSGFTLIELLLVIAIIGILIGFLSISFFGVRNKTQDAQRKSDIITLKGALEQYRSDNSVYMPDASFTAIACGAPFVSATGVTYSQTMPCDPEVPTKKYFYHTYNNGLSYILASCLENNRDTSGTAVQPSFWDATGPAFPPLSCTPAYYYIVQNP